MSAMASQLTSLTIVYSTVYSGAEQRKHQSSASLAFVRGIHHWPVNSPSQRASNADKFSIWWHHHELYLGLRGTCQLIRVYWDNSIVHLIPRIPATEQPMVNGCESRLGCNVTLCRIPQIVAGGVITFSKQHNNEYHTAGTGIKHNSSIYGTGKVDSISYSGQTLNNTYGMEMETENIFNTNWIEMTVYNVWRNI